MRIENLKYHLMPRNGWLNDPNGLVYFKDNFHIFYQADEKSIDGHENKAWGHYITKDFITYERHDFAILPDTKFDRNGAYSGSAIVEKDILYLFYTGNVKHDGNHDYITSGREHNLMRVESKDGIHFTNKVCLLRNEDYPKDCTNHVRDPKVYVKEGLYHLVLGARLLDNTSCVLEYVSKDLYNWKYLKRYTPKDTMGFMIECPDYIEAENEAYIICCPQGLQKNQYEFQNTYDCGYYQIQNKKLIKYHTLDYGFDFYAPQTFNGIESKMLIGWIGMPDNDYIDFCTEWNQTLSLPRRIEFKNGMIYQQPIDQIKTLRYEKQEFKNHFRISKSSNIELRVKNNFWIHLNSIVISFQNNDVCLDLTKCKGSRTKRFIKSVDIKKMSIYVDESVLEIYINDGEYTMTSRFYDLQNDLSIYFEGLESVIAYEMKGFKIK